MALVSWCWPSVWFLCGHRIRLARHGQLLFDPNQWDRARNERDAPGLVGSQAKATGKGSAAAGDATPSTASPVNGIDSVVGSPISASPIAAKTGMTLAMAFFPQGAVD